MNVFYRFVKADFFVVAFSFPSFHTITSTTTNPSQKNHQCFVRQETFRNNSVYFQTERYFFFRGVVLEARQVEKHIYILSSKCLFIFLLNTYRTERDELCDIDIGVTAYMPSRLV